MDKVIKVLMIDDEERFCKTTARILETRNMTVKTLTRGEEAVPELEKNPYDVVLLDIKMPGISGVETLGLIKKLQRPPEVIILTGHASADIAVQTTHLDAYDYLLKPCDPEELIVKILQAYERVIHK
ncbi:MAG: response regulator [Desulfobacteraceae bacterium]|nr:response regulator [Desulfobacteraceae bacterium]MBU4055065.1 response regulator [Pseudomonadota bacterium]